MQINSGRLIQKLDISVLYNRPSVSSCGLSVFNFADAREQDNQGQLAFRFGKLFADFTSGSVFHALNWFSRKSKRSASSTASCECEHQMTL